MNVANLQLQGLYLALASITNALVAKGLLTREEVDQALRLAEQTALSEERLVEEMRPSGREAIAFPARLLIQANNGASETQIPIFSQLARLVGQTKDQHSDHLQG